MLVIIIATGAAALAGFCAGYILRNHRRSRPSADIKAQEIAHEVAERLQHMDVSTAAAPIKVANKIPGEPGFYRQEIEKIRRQWKAEGQR